MLLTYVFSCRTKLEKLLCLKDRGNRSLENSAGFHTMKLHQDIRQSVARPMIMTFAEAELSFDLRPSPLQETTSMFSALSIKSYLKHQQVASTVCPSDRAASNRNAVLTSLSGKAGARRDHLPS
jgi:hypothetical protein